MSPRAESKRSFKLDYSTTPDRTKVFIYELSSVKYL